MRVMVIYTILLCPKSSHGHPLYCIDIIAMVIVHVMKPLWRINHREVEMWGRDYWDIHVVVTIQWFDFRNIRNCVMKWRYHFDTVLESTLTTRPNTPLVNIRGM